MAAKACGASLACCEPLKCQRAAHHLPPFCPALPAPPAVAVLAFFAFRPRKGWLRRRGSAAPKQGILGGLTGLELSPSGKVLMTPMPTGVLDSFLPPEANKAYTVAQAAPGSAGSSDPANTANMWVAHRHDAMRTALAQQLTQLHCCGTCRPACAAGTADA